MATRRVATTPDEVFLTDEERALQLQQPANDDEEMSPADRVAAMMTDFRNDDRASVKLYKRGTVKSEWCADYSVADFEAGGMEMVRREWGAGDFEIRLYATKPGTNLFVVRARTFISIRARADNPAPLVQQQQNQNSELAQVLAAISAQMSAQQQTMMELLARPTAPPPDPMAQMTNMLTLAASMRQAFAPPPAQPVMEMFATLKAFKEFSAEMGVTPPEDKEPSMMQLAGQMLPMIKEMLPQQNPAAQAVPQLTMPASFATATPPTPEIDPRQMALPEMETPQPQTQSQTQQQDENEVNALQKLALMNLLRKLVQMAQTNADKQAAADLILDKAPDEVIEFLDADGEDWWNVLAQAAPDVAPHKLYFFEVQKLVRAGLEDDAPASP